MDQVLKYFGSNSQLNGRFEAVPFEWTPSNSTKRRITVIPNDRSKYQKRKYYICVSAFCILLQSTCSQMFNLESTQKKDHILRVWISNVLLCVVTCYWNTHHLGKNNIATSINGLVQYDEMHPKPSVPFLKKPLFEKLCEMSIHLVQITADFAIPFGCVIVLPWVQPLKLSLVGYWPFELMYRAQQNNLVIVCISYIGKFSAIVFSFWIWTIIKRSITLVYCILVVSTMLAHNKNLVQ